MYIGSATNKVISIAYGGHATGIHMMYIGHCNTTFMYCVHTLCILEDKQLIQHSYDMFKMYMLQSSVKHHVKAYTDLCTALCTCKEPSGCSIKYILANLKIAS